ncbi:hypothetical protein niasHT_034535 [Heterodera trifolii]|uniref:Uncharacterized protein n=1 Tax=Heterodera trifolii TaxID=157864 RepID=A0ABD2I3A3_9BILA
MGNNRRTARLAHTDDASADQLAREDWAHFEMVERQLDELLEHHADKLDEEGDVLGVDMVTDQLNEVRKTHPFDPSTLPPTHSRNPTPYANHYSPTLQMLLELGVDLFEVCQATKIGSALLLRLDPERDVKAKIFWLVKRCGVHEADIDPYLNRRNPYFLLQSFDDWEAEDRLSKLVMECRYRLNIPQERIDARGISARPALAVRCRRHFVNRHEFPSRLRKANYVPKTADHITLEQFCHPSDHFFAGRRNCQDTNR